MTLARAERFAAVPAQHAEEASFQWLRRDLAVAQPHYSLTDLAKLDNQVEAHLDGLRVAGYAGWEACREELKWEEPGEVFAAAATAFHSGVDDRIESVVDVGCSTPELECGLVSALAWIPGESPLRVIAGLLSSDNPSRRRVGVAARAVRREDLGQVLDKLLSDKDLRVRARSLRAAGELGRMDLRAKVARAATEEDEACRYWGAWSAARLGDRSEPVRRALSQFAQQSGPFQERAVHLAVRLVDLSASRSWLAQLWRVPTTVRAATIGAGALGDPAVVPKLMELMNIDEIARVAGEAFSMITGVDLAYEDLERNRPEGFESGPTEDASDENVALDPDENLPWPDPNLVAAWWARNGARFPAGGRYLLGQELNPLSIAHAARNGFQRQRASAALEFGLLDPRKPLFEVRARGDWQRQLLSAWWPPN